MSFINWLIDSFNSLSSFFHQLYLDCYYAGFPLKSLCDALYGMSDLSANVAWAFYDFGTWAYDVWDRVQEILDFDAIGNYFKSWFDWAEWAWAWILDAAANVGEIISTWWSGVWFDVQTWVNDRIADIGSIIEQVEAWLVSLQGEWDSFKVKIPSIEEVISWVSNYWSNILGDLSLWWNDRLTDVQSLIDTSLAPLVDVINTWEIVRDGVVDFISDPLQWLYDRIDEFFERFW